VTHRALPLALRLLAKRLPPVWRDFVIGDLEEEFASRRLDSLIGSQAWLWWQTVRCLVVPLPEQGDIAMQHRPQGDSMMQSILSDLRHALRLVGRAPFFAAAVIAVMALGIGASTTLFGVVNAVLLRPVPFEEPDRLMRIFATPPGGTPGEVSPGQFYDWQRDARSFEHVALSRCCRLRDVVLSGSSPQSVKAAVVSAGFFETVRVRPSLGRTFRSEEDSPDGRHVVILSDRFWRTVLGGAPNVIGRKVMLNDESYSIVGVIPPAQSAASWFPMAADVWIPLGLTPEQRIDRQNHNLDAVARLKHGVEPAQAQSELGAIAARLGRDFPKTDSRWSATVTPMQQAIVGDSVTMLLVLLGAAGLVLLIACANVGNLLFTRALGRRKEVAIRLALGAGRGRVVQQLLIEALLLAAIGGVVGLFLASATLRLASAFVGSYLPRAGEISIDARVMLFVVAVSMMSGVLAGLLPALRAIGPDLRGALHEGGRSGGSLGVGTRRALIACEVALSVVLLMGAGLMLRTLLALQHSEIGFDAHNVVTLRIALVEARYPTAARRSAFFNEALNRIRAVPGVEAAGSTDDLPFTDGSAQPLRREEYVEGSHDGKAVVQVRQIAPGYLRAMRIPVLRGRDVVENDSDVLLVSQEAARLVWGADSLIGGRATLPLLSKTTLRQVIGVVGDIKQRSPGEPPTPTVYYYSRDRSWTRASIVVRTSLPPQAIESMIVAAIHSVDPQQLVKDVRTMEDVIDAKLSPQRFGAMLLGTFAGVALLLAALGIYGVIGYIVRGRRHEIGIRAALGARTGHVVWLVVVEAMTPTVFGIGAGAVVALILGRLLESLVFGVTTSDPLTLAGVAMSLAVVAIAASAVPAYRASRLDVVGALRAE
jgi:putative ABC transport system permease protein